MKKNRKTILITGASKRIGAGIAKILAKNNFNLIIHYNKSKKEAEKLCSQLNSKEEIAFAVDGNLMIDKEVKDIIYKAQKKVGDIFCLINNASTFEYDNLETFNNSFWKKHLIANLKAPMNLSKYYSKSLSKNYRGNIINIIDQRVLNLTPHFLSYTISKSGLWTLTKTLALHLAPRIKVNAIGPGPALKSKFQTNKQFEAQCKKMPLGIGTNPEEIGKTILFLISSSSITGQMIVLDGGQHLGWGQVKKTSIIRD